jgi:hypothetical protein
MANNSASGGVGFLGLLFLLFLGLKLGKVIDWSWWWVTVPLWGGFALIALIVLVSLLIITIFKMFK